MKNQRNLLPEKIYIIIGVILAVGFLGTYAYCTEESGRLRTYYFTEDDLTIPQDRLLLSVSVTKEWNDDALHPDDPAGAQYDGISINGAGEVFKNWSATMVFSQKVYIDSSWNGDFSSDGNTVTFVAKGDPATVQPYDRATFGAVMYAVEKMSLTSYTLSGYRIVNMINVPLFWILVFLSIVWFIAFLMHVVLHMRTKRYCERQELDAVIIKQTMNTFTGFIDAKDTYTKGHSVRVAEYATEIARRMKLGEDQVTQLYYISLMLDCGKIGIRDAVLQKPDKLTEEEYKQIQSHTITGDAILVNFTAIPDIRDGAHFHHERYDGKGYPTGLKGKDIPLCARIICVADSFDAMNSNRCYRKHLTEENIITELTENAGKQFDPDIVPVMIEMIKDGFTEKIQEIYPSGYDADPTAESNR
ncbi:MAG: HD domain-containing protein [Lachnospiraceae bacterium]|nr:HD domain-containing protein [Lachnospiraceae bacterium]